LSPDDIATLLTSIAASIATLSGARAMLARTSAEIAALRAGQEAAHAETKKEMRTNRSSTSLGDASTG